MPIIQFERTIFSAVEPLSNYFIDSKSVILTFVRSGDMNAIVAIEYFVIDGKVEDSGSGNQTVHGLETFLSGATKKQISIRLKADRSTSNDTFLTVILSEIEGPTIAKVGKNRSAVIQIKNREVNEPLLPGIPLITNEGSSPMDWISQASPLHCIMVCFV